MLLKALGTVYFFLFFEYLISIYFSEDEDRKNIKIGLIKIEKSLDVNFISIKNMN